MAERKVPTAGNVNKTARLTRSSKILKVIIKAIEDRKGEGIVTLDLRKIPEAVADFFIICEGSANIHVKGIADSIEEMVKRECGENPYKIEGTQALQWVLIDYVNVVVHVFQKETRKFYRLEEMWSDAVITEHEEELPIPLGGESSKGKTVKKQTNQV